MSNNPPTEFNAGADPPGFHRHDPEIVVGETPAAAQARMRAAAMERLQRLPEIEAAERDAQEQYNVTRAAAIKTAEANAAAHEIFAAADFELTKARTLAELVRTDRAFVDDGGTLPR